MLQSNPTLSDMKQEIDNKIDKSSTYSIDYDGYKIINKAIDTTSTSIDQQQYGKFELLDKNNNTAGVYEVGQNQDGTVYTILSSQKNIDNINIDNNVTLQVHNDGTKTINFSDPTAWRNALGIHYSTISLTPDVSSLTTGELYFVYEDII